MEWEDIAVWLLTNASLCDQEKAESLDEACLFGIDYESFVNQYEYLVLVQVDHRGGKLRELLYKAGETASFCVIRRASGNGTLENDVYELTKRCSILFEELLTKTLNYVQTLGVNQVHIFVAPPISEKLKSDRFWDKKFRNNSRKSGDERAYGAYRNTIDELIISSFLDHSEKLFGTDRTLYVGELCGGDGSLGR